MNDIARITLGNLAAAEIARKSRIHPGGSYINDGWDKCADTISNEEVWGPEKVTDELIDDVLGGCSGEMETCPMCHGHQKMVLGNLGKIRYSRCRDCDTIFGAPIVMGVVQTLIEEAIDL